MQARTQSLNCPRRCLALLACLAHVLLGGSWRGGVLADASGNATSVQSSNTTFVAYVGTAPGGVPGLAFTEAALAAAGLQAWLSDPARAFTLFAPLDTAWDAALSAGVLACSLDFFVDAPCRSRADLLRATNLPRLLCNHVVAGDFPPGALAASTAVRMACGAVQSVFADGEGTFVGPARLLGAPVAAANGIVYAVDMVLTGDRGLNGTAVQFAEKLGGFGPFNVTKRTQLFSVAQVKDVRVSLLTVLAGWSRIHNAIAGTAGGLPLDGGLFAPMAVSFNPPAQLAPWQRAAAAAAGPGGAAAAAVAGPSAASGAPAPGLGTAEPGAGLPAPAAALAAGAPIAGTAVPHVTNARARRRLAAAAPAPAAPLAAATLPGGWRPPPLRPFPRPPDNDTLAFMSIRQLGALLRSRQTSAMELAQLFLARLRRYDNALEFVVTYTEDLAMQQAKNADRLLAQGVDLGPLHGIPYGLKDLFAISGYRTTWGLQDRVNQSLGGDATAYTRLRTAGAVHVAKVATGEMAFDDVWWGGQVKNPWNLAEGASGSSAGPAAAVAAGALPFSVGTETEGSIVSPAERCGAGALRPSFGAIGRAGVMRMVDTMDKVGPFCRSAEDCALVFDVLRGREASDPASRDISLPDPWAIPVANLTIGVLPSAQAHLQEMVAALGAAGVTLVPFNMSLGAPAADLILAIMMTEAAASFDHWQRAGLDDASRRQDFWPPLLRLGRMVPGVEYVQAQRARGVLMREAVAAMDAAGVDAFIGNATELLAAANLGSLPTMVVAAGLSPLPGAPASPRRQVTSAGIFARPDADSTVLAIAMAWQAASSYHVQRPPVDDVEPEVLVACLPMARCALAPAMLAALDPPQVRRPAAGPVAATERGATSG